MIRVHVKRDKRATRARAKEVLAVRRQVRTGGSRTSRVWDEPSVITLSWRKWKRNTALRIALWLLKEEPMPITDLIPMESFATDPAPDTFVAFDLKDGTQLVGWFVRFGIINYPRVQVVSGYPITAEDSIVVDPPQAERGSGQEVEIPFRNVVRGYWAPLGYRADNPTFARE